MLARSAFTECCCSSHPSGTAGLRHVCFADYTLLRSSCLRLIGRPAQYHSVKTALCKHACTICFHRVLLFFPSVRNRRPQTRLLCRLYAASQLLSETDWASRPIPLCENSSLQACLHDLFSQSATVPYFSQSILLFRSRRICRLLPGSGSLQMPAPVLQGARRR